MLRCDLRRNPEMPESQAIASSEIGCTNDAHTPARPMTAAQLVADQQTGEIVRRRFGGEFVEQPLRADAEQVMQQSAGRARTRNAFTERRLIERARLARQHRRNETMLAQMGKNLTGHAGGETLDAAAADNDVLRMRSRQAEDRILAVILQRAENLNLLAAHDVGQTISRAAGQSRHDEGFAALRLDGAELRHEIGNGCRTVA